MLILTLNICNDYPKQSSKYRSKDGTRKRHTDIDKNNKQKTVHSFFIRTILNEQWDLLENTNKIRTIKAEINTRNFLSKFGKQKCTGINKSISKDNLSTRWGVISTTDEQNFDKYCSSI